MSGIARLMQMGAAGAGNHPKPVIAIEDYFSTYLYTGTGSTQTITNGIDLAGEGGLVWTKHRTVRDHYLFDTERGVGNFISSNLTSAQGNSGTSLTAFNSDGFTLGGSSIANDSGTPHASWTFRKAPRFFDVVTYTGDGVAGRQIAHGLGVEPGMVVVKKTSAVDIWAIYHRTLGAGQYLSFSTDPAYPNTQLFNNTAPTSDLFTLGANDATNGAGKTYVAYLFAHDPLGPSGDGSDGLIACGSYTGNGSTDGPEIDLGWEPQWVLHKSATETASWSILDNMRGIASGGNDARLYPDLSLAEGAGLNVLQLTPTGFKLEANAAGINDSGDTYIYIAIRRGPMRAPESGTEVFAPVLNGPIQSAGFPVDFTLSTTQTSQPNYTFTRITGINTYLATNSTNGEAGTGLSSGYDNNTGIDLTNWSGARTDIINWMFRRAPGFFDVVAYTGDGTAGRTVPHNLGVAPEMMIVKVRSTGRSWYVYVAPLGNSKQVFLNSDDGAPASTTDWNNTDPSETDFTLGASINVNGSGNTYIAYLFATLPGVSKVGSYTGNGSSQTIDCGFTSGARFILIKRTDAAGDWYVWDTARGIVTGNDPHLSLNTTAAEVTTDDSVDPEATGFIVNQVAATNINVSSASYIFLAIA